MLPRGDADLRRPASSSSPLARRTRSVQEGIPTPVCMRPRRGRHRQAVALGRTASLPWPLGLDTRSRKSTMTLTSGVPEVALAHAHNIDTVRSNPAVALTNPREALLANMYGVPHGMRAQDSACGGAVVRRGQGRPRRPIRAGILAASGEKSSRANRREDKTEEDKKSLTKRAPEFPLALRARTTPS